MPFKTTLEAALAELKKRGIIKSNGDIMKPLGITSRGTVSAYVTGTTKISPSFQAKFEKIYGIKLDEFENIVSDTNKKQEPNGSAAPPENGQNIQEKYIALLEKQLADKEGIERELQELKNQILSSRSQYDRKLKAVHAYLQIIYQRSIIHFARTENVDLKEVEDDMDIPLAALLDAD